MYMTFVKYVSQYLCAEIIGLYLLCITGAGGNSIHPSAAVLIDKAPVGAVA